MNLLEDFGGNGPVMHLAHATGFPPACYRQLVAGLQVSYRVLAFPQRPLWPDSAPVDAPTWRPLADDLVEALDLLRLTEVVGVGHSIGGVLTLWAAIARPDLFSSVVLIDPVLLPPVWLALVRWMRALGLGERLPLVQRALHRRSDWPDQASCFAHLRSRPLFARWSDGALWDYIRAGTRPSADGRVELAFPRTWEAHIFATTPVDVWRDVPHLTVPALVLRGELSDTFRPACHRRVERLLPGVRSEVIAGAGHLLPMERPQSTASAILRLLGSEDGQMTIERVAGVRD